MLRPNRLMLDGSQNTPQQIWLYLSSGLQSLMIPLCRTAPLGALWVSTITPGAIGGRRRRVRPSLLEKRSVEELTPLIGFWRLLNHKRERRHNDRMA